MNAMLRWILPPMLVLGALTAAPAQNWPDRPIKFISSQAAGGGTDIIGRVMADQLSARPFRRPADRARYLAGLHKAGLPDT